MLFRASTVEEKSKSLDNAPTIHPDEYVKFVSSPFAVPFA